MTNYYLTRGLFLH